MKFEYTKERPLRVCTTFSGYDSQCMALDRIGIPYELVACLAGIFGNLFDTTERIKTTLF